MKRNWWLNSDRSTDACVEVYILTQLFIWYLYNDLRYMEWLSAVYFFVFVFFNVQKLYIIVPLCTYEKLFSLWLMDGDCCCFVRVVHDSLLKALSTKLKVIVVEGTCTIFCRSVGMSSTKFSWTHIVHIYFI